MGSPAVAAAPRGSNKPRQHAAGARAVVGSPYAAHALGPGTGPPRQRAARALKDSNRISEDGTPSAAASAGNADISKGSKPKHRRSTVGPVNTGEDELAVSIQKLQKESNGRMAEFEQLKASLLSVKRERDELRRAVEDLKIQNDEQNEEIHWMAKELSTLQKQANDARCREWLHGSEGRSTVIAAPDAAAMSTNEEIEQTGGAQGQAPAEKSERGDGLDVITGFAAATDRAIMEAALHGLRKQVEDLQRQIASKDQEIDELKQLRLKSEASNETRAASIEGVHAPKQDEQATGTGHPGADDLSSELSDARNRLAKASSDLAARDSMLCEINEQLSAARALAADRADTHGQSEQQIQQLQAELAASVREYTRSKAVIADRDSELARLNAQLAEAIATKQTTDANPSRVSSSGASIGSKESRFAAEKEAEISRLREELREARELQASQQQRLDDAGSTIESLRHDLQIAEQRGAHAEGAAASKSAELEHINALLTEEQLKARELTAALSLSNENISVLTHDLSSARNDFDEVSQRLAKMEHEIRTHQAAAAEALATKASAEEAARRLQKELGSVQEQHTADLQAMQARLSDAVGDVGKLKAQVAELNSELNRRRDELLSVQSAAMSTLEREKEILTIKDELREAKASLAEATRNLAAKQKHLDSLQTELSAARISVQDARAAAEIDREAANRMSADVEALRANVAEAKEQLLSKGSELSKIRNLSEALQQALDSERLERQRLAETLSKAAEAADVGVRAEVDRLKSELAESESRVEKLQANLDEREEKAKELLSTVSRLEQELALGDKKLKAVEKLALMQSHAMEAAKQTSEKHSEEVSAAKKEAGELRVTLSKSEAALKALKASKREVEQKASGLQDELKGADTARSKALEQLRALEAKVKEQSKELKRLKDSVEESERRAGAAEDTARAAQAAAEKRIAECGVQMEAAKSSLRGSEAACQAASAEVEGLKVDLAKANEQLRRAEAAVQSMMEAARIGEVSEEVHAAEDKTIASHTSAQDDPAARKEASAAVEADILRAQLADLQDCYSEWQGKYTALSAAEATLQGENASLRKDCATLTEEIGVLKRRESEKDLVMAQLYVAAADLKAKVRKLEQRLERQQTKRAQHAPMHPNGESTAREAADRLPGPISSDDSTLQHRVKQLELQLAEIRSASISDNHSMPSNTARSALPPRTLETTAGQAAPSGIPGRTQSGPHATDIHAEESVDDCNSAAPRARRSVRPTSAASAPLLGQSIMELDVGHSASYKHAGQQRRSSTTGSGKPAAMQRVVLLK